MGTVILICGKICSGKSWYARTLQNRKQAVILSTDEVTYDLTDNAQGEGYDAFARRVNLYLRKKAAEIALAGCDVILDWGFWTRKDREEITAYFRDRNVPMQWHYMDISDDLWQHHIVARNEKVLSGQGGSDFYVDEGLKEKVLSLFQVPDPSEIDVWIHN